MTDKEIIINGVDVSGCAFLDEWKHCDLCQSLIKTFDGRTKCLTEPDLRCETFPNCILKQSARKDERIRELEIKLKHKKNSYKREKEVKELSISRWEEDVESYEKKLSQIVELCNEIEDRDFNCTLPIDCDTCELNEACNEAFQQDRAIYFEKLQQIKHIAQGE